MFIRKTALNKTGLLDETFFMYGEDIDLSYRIIKEGFKNYYLSDTTIIHYKGESTKKGSLNYVKVFYNAMIIFAKKHFNNNQSGLYTFIINVAIILRGMLTLVANLFASSYLFIVDGLLSFLGIYVIKSYWDDMVKYADDYYPKEFLFIVVPVYILIWLFASFLSGAYDKPFRFSNILRGVSFGTIAIAVLYAFLPDQWRFSRAIIVLGAAWTSIEMLLTRTLYHLIKYQSFSSETDEERRTLIAGSSDALRAEGILRQLGHRQEIVLKEDLQNLNKAVAINRVNQIVFCAHDLFYKEIISQIIKSGNKIDYKILNAESSALIGSNSKNTAGDLYVAERSYRLLNRQMKRSKRVLDIFLCLLFVIISPLLIFKGKFFFKFMRNWLKVLTGKFSWVGISPAVQARLPGAAEGVLHPADQFSDITLSEEEIAEAEIVYAKYYTVSDDLKIIFNNISLLGR